MKEYDYLDRFTQESRSKYREVCFVYHGKKCIICGESKIVTVHHYDGNHNNNSPENLIPLCANHHMYIHSQYKDEVEKEVELYYLQFIEKMKGEQNDRNS